MNFDRNINSIADFKKLIANEVAPKIKDGTNRDSMAEAWALLVQNRRQILDVLKKRIVSEEERRLYYFFDNYVRFLDVTKADYKPENAVKAAELLISTVAKFQ